MFGHLRMPAMICIFILSIANVSAEEKKATFPRVNVPADIQGILDEYSRAWKAKDLEGLAKLFAPEGMALPNGMLPAKGSAAIQESYAQGAGMPLVLTPIAFGSNGDLAYLIGMFGVSAERSEMGKFTLVFRKLANGKWAIVSDMDNLNFRPQPPKK